LSNPETEQVLKRRITDKSIQLVDADKSPLFTKQMSQIGEKGYRAGLESPGASSADATHRGVEPEDAELVSDTASFLVILYL